MIDEPGRPPMDADDELRRRLGPVGVWVAFDPLSPVEILRVAAEVEGAGLGALWVNEGTGGRDPFAVLALLAGATRGLTLGLGIASVYARDATAAHAGARTIAELSGGRFVMGLGVSHRSSVAARGHAYGPPLHTMTAYLDAYRSATWAPAPVADPPLVIAALGDGMLRLAATATDGAFPFLVPVGYVARARTVLDEATQAAGAGVRATLVVAQPAMLGTGDVVRAAAAGFAARYLRQPNYRANLVRAGIDEAALDRMDEEVTDALVVTGDGQAIRDRVDAMRAAGADHVAVIPLSAEGPPGDAGLIRSLATAAGR